MVDPSHPLITALYIGAAALFIAGLKMLNRATTARRGNLVSGAGMLLAIVATCLLKGMSFHWILAGAVIGSGVGAIAATRVKMTAMPEMVGLFNGFGGLASMLVAWSEFHKWRAVGWRDYQLLLGGAGAPDAPLFTAIAIAFTTVVGAVTFSGSLVAFLKLSERITGRPILFKGQQLVNALILVVILLAAAGLCADPEGGWAYAAFFAVMLVGLVLGVASVIPIGGADMPVVISLLNSYSGIAAAAAGFIILNNGLIVAGSLVGASGIVLTKIMCKAMNRSLANVLFSGFGATQAAGGADVKGEVKPISAEDAYFVLEAARSVVFVPGYGMAVAQAQHVVRELGQLLEKNGAEVKYCIHPVAGRMPGHMNVLLAEANVPYEQLVEPGDVNPVIGMVDAAIVIGANDVVNPAAREDRTSPLWGMPIINVDEARLCMVLKRSMRAGFAGVENPLFFKENTRMLFGDAKASISALVSEFKTE